jgi:hypothetical protein
MALAKMWADFFGSGDANDASGFARALRSRLDSDRQVDVRIAGETVGVHFYNVPKNVLEQVTTSDPLALQNHVSITVSGFGVGGAAPPTGKVRVEVDDDPAAPKLAPEYRLRSREGEPAKMAKYIAKFVNEVSEEVATNYRCAK